MSDTALDSLTVLDLSTELAGAYASKLLADLGARVIMLETAEPSGLRRWNVHDER